MEVVSPLPVRVVRESNVPHPGILGRSDFYQNYELRCYEPSDDLKPYVVHIWTQRKKPGGIACKPLEIQTGPNLYLYVHETVAFIQGVCGDAFRYDPTLPGVYAGVKFRPGGFYAFWRHSLKEMSGRTIDAETVLPGVDALRPRLSSMSDSEIVGALEHILRAKHPIADKSLQYATTIMDIIHSDDSLSTVRAVAREVGKSERSLQLLFHDHVGVSLKWALTRKRLIETLTAFDASHTTWTDTAAQRGYSSQSHFTREFKQAAGISPSAYQKLQKSADLI